MCIWWVVFFAMLPIGVKSNPPQIDKKLEGFDSGAPKNPEIGKKFLFTTLITFMFVKIRLEYELTTRLTDQIYIFDFMLAFIASLYIVDSLNVVNGLF